MAVASQNEMFHGGHFRRQLESLPMSARSRAVTTNSRTDTNIHVVLPKGRVVMREETLDLVSKGRLPSSKDSVDQIGKWQSALEKIEAPISDEEAKALTHLFPDTEDDCFGMAWSLIHLVESAPNWPLRDCLRNERNPWFVLLRERASRST
jgi:hypothetical protein